MANDDVMNNQTQFIHCMLLPLKQHYLLLPNSTITEVIPKTRISNAGDIPTGWLGHVQWEDISLPIIDLEGLITSSENNTDEFANKLCIISGINPDAAIEYYAIPCTGSPQLITLNSAALQLTHDAATSPYLHCQIKIGNKVAFIPNLDHLEKQIDSQTNS